MPRVNVWLVGQVKAVNSVGIVANCMYHSQSGKEFHSHYYPTLYWTRRVLEFVRYILNLYRKDWGKLWKPLNKLCSILWNLRKAPHFHEKGRYFYFEQNYTCRGSRFYNLFYLNCQVSKFERCVTELATDRKYSFFPLHFIQSCQPSC